jgi:hypothetical protein
MRLREMPALESLPRATDNPSVVYYAFVTPLGASDRWRSNVVATLAGEAGEVAWEAVEDDPEKWIGRATMTPQLRAILFGLIDEAPPEELERSKGIRRLASLDAERRETVSVVFFSRATP